MWDGRCSCSPLGTYICICVYVYVGVLSRISHTWPFASPWTVVCQAPLFTGFPKQEYWSGLPFPSLGDLPNPGIEPVSLISPILSGLFFISAAWKACMYKFIYNINIGTFYIIYNMYSNIYNIYSNIYIFDSGCENIYYIMLHSESKHCLQNRKFPCWSVCWWQESPMSLNCS